MRIDIYTDGSWFMNKNRGGYGVIMIIGGQKYEFSQGFSETTSNRMELMGAIVALRRLPEFFSGECDITLYSDSKYVVNSVNKGWIENWAHSNWTRYNGKILKNPDLWTKLYPLIIRHKVKFVWIEGHNGNKIHDRADKIARSAARGKKLLIDRRDDENILVGATASGNSMGSV